MRLRLGLAPTLTVLGFLLLWEGAVRRSGIQQFLLPQPTAIAGYMSSHVGLLWRHTQVTMEASLLGFLIALVFGIALAVAIVWSATFEDAVYPLVIFTQVIPKVAIAPLLIVYMGFDLQPKVFLAFLVSFFPVVINATLGLKSMRPELAELLATFKANKWQVMWKVRFRQAMPYIVEGAKIGTTLAVIGAVVGEFSAGNLGLGYLIASSALSLNTLLGFSALVCLSAAGILLFGAVDLLGRALTSIVTYGR